jgi:hypothetical protein
MKKYKNIRPVCQDQMTSISSCHLTLCPKKERDFAGFARLVAAHEASLENALNAGFFTFAFFKYKVIL